jgi:hypothetical protein
MPWIEEDTQSTGRWVEEEPWKPKELRNVNLSKSEIDRREHDKVLNDMGSQRDYASQILPAMGNALRVAPIKTAEGMLSFVNIAQEMNPAMIPSNLITKAIGSDERPNILEGASLYLRNVAKNLEPEYESGTPQYYAYNAVNSLAQNVIPIGAGVLSGGSAIPLFMMGTTVAGEKYNELRERGISDTQAKLYAGMYGAAEAIGEKVSIGKFLKGSLLNRMILGTLFDIPGEQVTEVLQAGIDKGFLKEEDAFSKQRFLDTLILTGIQGPIMGAGASGMSRLAGNRAGKKPTKIEVVPRTIEPVLPQVETDDKIENKSPTYGAKYLDALIKDKNVGSFDGDNILISKDIQGDKRIEVARALIKAFNKTTVGIETESELEKLSVNDGVTKRPVPVGRESELDNYKKFIEEITGEPYLEFDRGYFTKPQERETTGYEKRLLVKNDLLKQKVESMEMSLKNIDDQLEETKKLAKQNWIAGKKEGVIEQIEKQKTLKEIKGNYDAFVKESRGHIRWLKGAEKYTQNKKGKIPAEYRTAITNVLSGNAYELKKFIDDQIEKGDIMLIPEDQLDLLAQSSIKEPTLDELRNRVGIVKQLVYQGRKMTQVTIGKERMDRAILIADINKSIRDEFLLGEPLSQNEVMSHEYVAGKIEMQRSRIARAAKAAWSSISYLKKAETILDTLGGMKDGTIIHKAIMGPMVEGERKKITMSLETGKQLKKAFDHIKKDIQSGKLLENYEVSDVVTNKWNAISIALNSGNSGNMESLKKGSGYILTDERIDAIVGSLNKNEKDFVKAIHDVLKWQLPHLQEAYKKFTGEDMPLVEGTYYPLLFDKRFNSAFADKMENQSLMSLYGNVISVARGMTIERTGGTYPPLLDFTAVIKHIENTNHFISYGKAVRDVNRIISNQSFKETVVEAIGEENYNQLRPWLKEIAGNRHESLGQWDSFMGFLKNNASLAILGYSFSTALLQPLATTQTISEIGLRDTSKGFIDFYRNPLETARMIYEKSPFMTMRTMNMDATVREMIEGQKTRIWEDHRIRDTYLAFMGIADKAVTLPSWYAAYQKQFSETNNEQEAIDYADKVVRQTQSSGAIKDLAQIQTGNNTRKSFVMLYSYFSSTFNQLVRTNERFRAGLRKGEYGFLDLAKSYTWMLVVPAVFTTLMRNGLFLDDDEPEKEFAKEFAKELVGYSAGTIPLLGGVINSVVGGYDYRPTPVVASVDAIKNAVASLKSDRVYYGRGAPSWVRNSTMATGYLTGLPTRQAMLLLDEAIEVNKSGELSADNIMGLIYSQRGKK